MNEDNIYNYPPEPAQNSFRRSDDSEAGIYGTEKKPIKEKNCPPGHYTSMDAGGKGHGINDGCGCVAVTVDISFIMPYPEVKFKEVNELAETDRGSGGYGSTN